MRDCCPDPQCQICCEIVWLDGSYIRFLDRFYHVDCYEEA